MITLSSCSFYNCPPCVLLQ